MTASNDLNISQAGYVVFDGTATFTGRTFQAGAGITLTNASGIAGNTIIGLSGGGIAVEHLTGTTGGQLNPDGSNNFNLLGGTVSAGTVPVAIAGSGSTLTTNIQISQALAAADATKIGLSNFDSSSFAVAATGFVTLANPSGNSWVDVTTATQTLAVNTGYVTDHTNVTYTLPSTASFGDFIKIVGKLGLATITPNANQQILMSSASGTVGATGTAVATNVGDCIELRCTTSGASTVWRADNWVGNWTLN